MPINVSEALDMDTSEIVSVLRFEPGAYVNGIYEKGDTFSFKTICSVQQPTPDELQMLPEGERNKDVKKFISRKKLRTTVDKEGLIADIVTFKGVSYKIVQAADWNSYGHTTAFGVRD